MSYLRAGFVGHLLDKKTPFQNVVPSGRICWSFFGQQKNAISKCRTFGPDLLGRPARLIQNWICQFFFVLFYPAPFLIIHFAPPHFCAKNGPPFCRAKNGPPDRRRRNFLAQGAKMARLLAWGSPIGQFLVYFWINGTLPCGALNHRQTTMRNISDITVQAACWHEDSKSNCILIQKTRPQANGIRAKLDPNLIGTEIQKWDPRPKRGKSEVRSRYGRKSSKIKAKQKKQKTRNTP